MRRIAIRLASRPKLGVVGLEREVWCQRRVCARRVWGLLVAFWLEGGFGLCRGFGTLLVDWGWRLEFWMGWFFFGKVRFVARLGWMVTRFLYSTTYGVNAGWYAFWVSD